MFSFLFRLFLFFLFFPLQDWGGAGSTVGGAGMALAAATYLLPLMLGLSSLRAAQVLTANARSALTARAG